MKISNRFIFVIAGLMMLPLSACDVTDPLQDVELIVDVEDAVVDFGGSPLAVELRPDRPSAYSDDVSNDLGIASVRELRQIELKPEFFSFTASASKSTRAAATGTVQLTVFLSGFPLPQMPITATIENNVVTDVSPSAISFAGQNYSVNEAAIDALLEALPAEERPTLADWKGATMNDVTTAINAALASNSIPISLGVRVTASDDEDPLTGLLILGEISIDAQVSQGAN